jgi:hypothetical protein
MGAKEDFLHLELMGFKMDAWTRKFSKNQIYSSFKREILARYLITGIFRETVPSWYQTLSEAAHKKIIRNYGKDRVQSNLIRKGVKVLLQNGGS